MSDYQKDKWWVSVLWGRIGVPIFVLISLALQAFFGVSMSQEEQATMVDLFGQGLSIGFMIYAGICAVISKIKENQKIKAP